MTPVPGSVVSTRSSRSAASVGAVGDDDHAGVDRVADPDAAAVVDADPGRARGDVQQRVQDRPVGDRVGAVAHRLGLAVRRGDRAGVEVVAADHDRRRDLAAPDELVDREARLGPVAVAEPADPRGQPLERDPLGCELEPALEQLVPWKELSQRLVDRRDVGRVARERGPPERPDAAAEERPDIGRDEARVCEGVRYAGLMCLPSQVVAIIENIAAGPDELEHRLRRARAIDARARRRYSSGSARAQRRGLLDREPGRHVAGQRIVRRRLVGDEVEVLAAPGELRNDLGGVAEQADRERSALGRGSAHTAERVVERVGRLVEVARLEPALDPARVDLDAEDRRAGHRRRERLRAAHPAEPGGEDRPPGEVGRAEVLLARRGEGLVRALEDPLRADVDPAPGRHLAEHRQAERLEPAELVPRRPARHEQRVRDQHARRPLACVRKTPTGLPLWTSSVSSSPSVSSVRTIAFSASCERAALPRAAVDDELLRALRDLGIEVVEQHPQRRLGRPRPRVQRGAAGRPDRAQVAAERLDERRSSRRRRSATRAPGAARRRAHHVQPVASTKPRARDAGAPTPTPGRRRSAAATTTTSAGEHAVEDRAVRARARRSPHDALVSTSASTAGDERAVADRGRDAPRCRPTATGRRAARGERPDERARARTPRHPARAARGTRPPARRRAARSPAPARCSRAPAAPSGRPRSPSRRDPPGPRSSGSSRRSPDGRATCSR